jgi:hypothetical protein
MKTTLGSTTSDPEDNLTHGEGENPLKKKNHQLNSRRRRKPLKKKKIINSTHGKGENPSKKKKKKTPKS